MQGLIISIKIKEIDACVPYHPKYVNGRTYGIDNQLIYQ
jgi:hypothetical protein